MRLNNPPFASLLTLASLVLGSSLSAQAQVEPSIVIRENQVIPSLGTLQGFNRLAISDDGTTFTLSSITSDTLRYMMRNNFPTFVNNIQLPEPGPPGDYTMRSAANITSYEVDSKNNIAWRLQTSNSGGGTGTTGNHTGIYYNLKLIHNDLDNAHTLAGIQDPFYGTAPGTFDNFGYRTFFGISLSNDGHLLLNCQLDSNGRANGGNTPRALILVKIDDFGNIENETLLALGDSNAVDTNIIGTGINSSQNAYQVANNGNWIASMDFRSIGGVNTSRDDDWAVVVNDPSNIIAREDNIIPGIGRVATNGAQNARVSINSFGDTVIMVRFGGTALDRIIKNGVVVAGEGAVALNLPSLAPNRVADLEAVNGPPIRITDTGDVFWYARVTGNSGMNRVFMRNQDVLIRRGVNSIDGTLIRDLDNGERAFAVSDNGRFWAGQVNLAGGGDDAIVMFDFGLVLPILGRDTNPATLSKLSGDARIGDLMVLSMDGSQGPGSLPLVALSLQQAIPGNPLGLVTGFGELLIDLTPGMFLGQIEGSPVTTGASSIAANIPLDPSLVNLEVFAQGVFWDVGAANGGARFHLTNGLHIIIGSN